MNRTAVPVPLDIQIAAVRREIAMRKRAYPRWVTAGRMTQSGADHEIRCMEAVLETLQSLENKLL